MKKIIVHNGFDPSTPVTPYGGEYIYKVIGLKEQRGIRFFLLEHDSWVKTVGDEMYKGRGENERWARVEEVETDDGTGEVRAVRELGFTRIA